MNWLQVSLELPEEIKISERADPAMAALYELPIPAESSRSAAKLLRAVFDPKRTLVTRLFSGAIRA
jgi:hypothetical protein